MMEEELIRQLAEHISARIAPAVPIAAAFWDKKAVCACLCMSESTLNKIVDTPDFPPKYRFPASSGRDRRGYPRWKAKDIMEWAERFRGKEVSL